ncbi:MAG TPA: hypothetical protein VFG87_14540 [Amycolatopsis sp.]|nr:hypothetical protein [Amycolatopsis sp.]
MNALEAHLDAIVLVGAQAVYLHTGDADLTVAPTTTDADIALSPGRLADAPLIEEALGRAGFTPGRNPGTWHGRGSVAIDLMVPEALSGAGGRRGARLPMHGNRVARRTLGLEPAIVDNEEHELSAFGDESRGLLVRVAGPAALLVAKLIKIEERRATPARQKPKDGLDVLRLLRVIDMPAVAARLRLLAEHEVAGEVTRQALAAIRAHGDDPGGPVATLAADATAVFADREETARSTAFLLQDLLEAYETCVTARNR